MRPLTPLPIDCSWQDTEQYVEFLLTFVSTSILFRNLCGGVHILDFLTRQPDLYTWVLPPDWRSWFELVDIQDVLDLLLREDLVQFDGSDCNRNHDVEGDNNSASDHTIWREYTNPPASLIEYVSIIRRLSLRRTYEPPHNPEPLPKHVAVGMKPKKIHEVTEFATFVEELSKTVDNTDGQCARQHDAPVVIDFGSGQNYLGRTLACPPYNKHVIAIEQRSHNVQGARGMDVHAKLAQKEKRMINKKAYKESLMMKANGSEHERSQQLNGTYTHSTQSVATNDVIPDLSNMVDALLVNGDDAMNAMISQIQNQGQQPPAAPRTVENPAPSCMAQRLATQDRGQIEYVEKELSSGDLTDIIQAQDSNTAPQATSSLPSMVVSIHSCGNLSHHALRSLVLNPHVRAVAVIGCCYNLLTERLGPATFKLPSLRSYHPRLEATSSSHDPHGFPMSKRLEDFEFDIVTDADEGIKHHSRGKGVRLNITARMMAVQAPHNWGPKDSEEFFTRHFYRALLQRILLDLGVVQMATEASSSDIEVAGGTLSGKDATGTPLIIGTLRKSCFTSFPAYVRGAIEKLSADPVDGQRIRTQTMGLLEDPAIIEKYEHDFAYAKKHLSIIWSLMAFSANVVESTILLDRWLWLKQQKDVKDAWVQSVFDYRQSPRNMVVVGLKHG